MTWTRWTSPATCSKFVAKRRCCRSEYLYDITGITGNHVSQEFKIGFICFCFLFVFLYLSCLSLLLFLALSFFLIALLLAPFLTSCTKRTDGCFYILHLNPSSISNLKYMGIGWRQNSWGQLTLCKLVGFAG